MLHCPNCHHEWTPADLVADEFLAWWTAYPLKVGKEAARKAWVKTAAHRPMLSVLLQAITTQRKSRRWREGFIPNPATWLNQHRWEDELPMIQPTVPRSLVDLL